MAVADDIVALANYSVEEVYITVHWLRRELQIVIEEVYVVAVALNCNLLRFSEVYITVNWLRRALQFVVHC